MPCTNRCVINSRAGGDHAYCECECHVGSLPAIPPSRERRVIGFDVPGKSVLDEVVDERNKLRDEVAELKRTVADMLEALNGLAYGIKTCGHGFVCICNLVKAEAIIAKIEGRERNPWLIDSPVK